MNVQRCAKVFFKFCGLSPSNLDLVLCDLALRYTTDSAVQLSYSPGLARPHRFQNRSIANLSDEMEIDGMKIAFGWFLFHVLNIA